MLARVRPNLGVQDLWRAVCDRQPRPSEVIEAAFAARFGFPHAVLFPTARSGLHSLLRSLEWRDAEILLPAYICAEVPYAITASGNLPRFVDSAANHFLPGPGEWEAAAGVDSKLAVIAPLYGYPIDPLCVNVIRRRSKGIFVLFDEAQSYGASDAWGEQVRDADGALFSLGLGKMVTGLAGGMLLLRDRSLYLSVLRYRDANFLRSSPVRTLELVARGISSIFACSEPALTMMHGLEFIFGKSMGAMMDRPPQFDPEGLAKKQLLSSEFQSRVGIIQLERLNEFISSRRLIGEYYQRQLSREGFKTFAYNSLPVWSRYPFAVTDRSAVIGAFNSRGVQISRFLPYSCVELPRYAHWAKASPNASLWANSMINLPNWFGMNLAQAERVVEALIQLRELDLGRALMWPTR